MRFGQINYINLAPFDVFIKSYPMPSNFKKFLHLHKSYPAKLNQDFLFQRIDAGFISSIAGYSAHQRKHATQSGIIAKGEVWSVLLLPNDSKKDYQSATSNALCEVLGLKGEVLIGDRALYHRYLNQECQDMGFLWFQKHRLPFVFGRLCFNKHQKIYSKISEKFNQKRIKIPYYILEKYAKNSSIDKEFILKYLKHIYYKIEKKETLGLKRFYRELLFLGIKKPSRFQSLRSKSSNIHSQHQNKNTSREKQ
ncbi:MULTISPECIES: MqnA/MqnD/SBP family protein [unclassified Helicobacter]|uniref:MqnA/MqnD/SBP family protein n=1 Tax=unclassified Helicobacter TaxID=2593540 RepID=UPI000CF1550B|nr:MULTISPECIES: MqnA/MqnD/SBP family protein [unclassified Helicobacter]